MDAITLEGQGLVGRTFLLGSGSGFILYLPVEQNTHDRNLLPIKWFGASEFGRKFYETSRLWLVRDGSRTQLDHHNQSGFMQFLDHAERTFQVQAIRLDGIPVPREHWEIEDGCAPQVSGEVWIRGDMRRHTAARFQFEPSTRKGSTDGRVAPER
jgi:hypothetical protein